MCDTCDQPIQPTTPKLNLTGLKLGSLLAASKDNQKKRLVSDIEFLNPAQYEYLENMTQQRFFTFLQKHWALKMIAAGATAKTQKGEVLQVNPATIRVVDKRWKGASHCICGKAIRYEYWIQQYGPIGSVHICEHTGLDKALVDDITKGYKKENQVRTEIVDIFVELKDKGHTIEDWYKEYGLEEKQKWLPHVRIQATREMIEKFIELKLPIPKECREALQNAFYSWKAAQRRSEQEELFLVQAKTTIDRLHTSQYEALRVAQAGTFATFQDLFHAIKEKRSTPEQLLFAENTQTFFARAMTEQNAPVDEQALAKRVLTGILNIDPNNTFAKSLFLQSQTRNLTVAQLSCIFIKKNAGYNTASKAKRPTLYSSYYASLINQQVVLPSDYTY